MIATTIALNNSALLCDQEWDRAVANMPIDADADEFARTEAIHQNELDRI